MDFDGYRLKIGVLDQPLSRRLSITRTGINMGKLGVETIGVLEKLPLKGRLSLFDHRILPKIEVTFPVEAI